MDTNKFAEVLSNAQKLMLDEDFNAKVEANARSFRNGGGIPSSSIPSSVPTSSSSNVTLLEDIMGATGNNTVPKNSKLPKEILESFSKTPAMTGDDSDNTTLGIISRKLENSGSNSSARQVVQEQRNYGSGVSSASNRIDYSLIKTIIDESVRRNLEEMKGSMLTESSAPSINDFRGMAIREGNKIQFLDSKGNLYEAVLKLKKKAK